MKNSVFLSIIIPVYNVEKYLERCVQSIENQNFSNYEIVLVNDGSTDSSLDLCKSICKKYNNVIIETHDNCGLGLTRNVGLSLASGKYVWFVDSDDFISDDCLNKLYEVAKSSDSIDMITFGWNIVDKDNRIIKNDIPNLNCNKVLDNDFIINNTMPDFIYNVGNTSNLHMSSSRSIFSRKFLLDNDLKFVSERKWISEDYYFYINIFKYVKKLYIINDAFYNYCQNSNSLTTTYREDRFEKLLTFYKKMDELVIDDNYNPECLNRLDCLFISNLIACLKMEAYYKNKVGFLKSYKKVKYIVNNDFVKEAFHDCNTSKKSWKILKLCIKYNLVLILYVLCYIQAKKDSKRRS